MAAELSPEISAALLKLQQDWTDQHNARLTAEEALSAERAAHADTRAELERMREKITVSCTPAERKVLEAMAHIQTCDLRAHANERTGWSRAIDSALATELARRGEKP